MRGGYGLYIDQVFLNPPLNVVLAQRANDVTIVNPGYPDPYSRGTVQSATPSISVSSENIRTPESKSVSLGVKRELTAGLALSADGVYSRGYNQFNNRDLNPRDPVTGLRPNPNYLRITQLRDRRPRLVFRAADVARAARRQRSRLRRVVHARQGHPRRRRVPLPGAGSVQSGCREVAGQQQPDAPDRWPDELAHAVGLPVGWHSAVPVRFTRGTSPPAATTTSIPSRTTGPISSIRTATRTIATPTTAISPIASATWDATPTSGRRS